MKFADAFADERESLETISRDAAAPAAADRPRKKTGDQVAPQFGRFYRRGLNCGGADEDDRCRWSHGALSHVIGRIRSRTRGQCGVRRFVGGRRVGTRRSGRRCGDRLHRGVCDRPVVGVATVRTELPGATVEPICVIECRRSCAAWRAANGGCRTECRPRSNGHNKLGCHVQIVCEIRERFAIAQRAGIRVNGRSAGGA